MQASEHLDRFRGAVVEELGFARVERLDELHIFIGQGEIEHIEVLLHAFFLH